MKKSSFASDLNQKHTSDLKRGDECWIKSTGRKYKVIETGIDGSLPFVTLIPADENSSLAKNKITVRGDFSWCLSLKPIPAEDLQKKYELFYIDDSKNNNGSEE